jgi:hypothetical protein
MKLFTNILNSSIVERMLKGKHNLYIIREPIQVTLLGNELFSYNLISALNVIKYEIET